MADNKQEAVVNRSFAYTDKDGAQHYFTRQNQGTIMDVVAAEHLKAYEADGTITLSDAAPASATPVAGTPARPGTTVRPAVREV